MKLNLIGSQEHIKRARFLDSECRHEGLVWLNLWEAPYKSDSVNSILDSCDAMHVAMNAMQSSIARCSNKARVVQILRDVLDRPLAARCHTHVLRWQAI